MGGQNDKVILKFSNYLGYFQKNNNNFFQKLFGGGGGEDPPRFSSGSATAKPK